jgi:hypothetical protein
MCWSHTTNTSPPVTSRANCVLLAMDFMRRPRSHCGYAQAPRRRFFHDKPSCRAIALHENRTDFARRPVLRSAAR